MAGSGYKGPPMSVGELVRGRVIDPPRDWLEVAGDGDHDEVWSRLERRSGFPEPYFKDDPRQHRRWPVRRRALILREDLREL